MTAKVAKEAKISAFSRHSLCSSQHARLTANENLPNDNGRVTSRKGRREIQSTLLESVIVRFVALCGFMTFFVCSFF